MVSKPKAVKAVKSVHPLDSGAAENAAQNAEAQKAVPAVKAPRIAVLRKPLAEAQAHNMQFVPLAKDGKVVAAAVCATSKGTNPKKARVYGYDNLANGGRVPKDKRVVLVTTDCPKKVGQKQWDALVVAVKAMPDATVAQVKADAQILGKTIRRAYRAGAIRFAL